MEEESEEARKVKKVMDPKEPTAAERKEHEATHLPFRNWCRHCVRGRGLQAGHYKVKEEERKVQEISIDYCFPASEGQEGITVLVARERGTRMTCATQVPRKGTTGSFAKNRLMAFLREIGYEYSPVILKSDGEPAVKAVVDEVALARGAMRTIKEESPKGSSGSNGIVERAILSVEQQVRVMKSALEERWGAMVPDKHPVIAWLVEYAAVLIKRCEVGKGESGVRRTKGSRGRRRR